LGLGWKLFGEPFLATEPIESLRRAIGTSDKACTPLYYADQFVIGNNSPAAEPFRLLQDQTVRTNLTTILMRITSFGLEWSVSCVGCLVGSIIYPTQQRLLPDYVPLNAGILATVTRDRLSFQAVEQFPAPWDGRAA
jgi:hypothetical protein